VILISNRRLQLGPITQELANLGLPFDPPGGEAIRDEPPIRATYSILRIIKDFTTNTPDYVAYRAVLALLHGVGVGTSKAIGDLCVTHSQNYHDVFYAAALPHWINSRPAAALTRVRSLIQQMAGWSLQDALGARTVDIGQLLTTVIFAGSSQVTGYQQEWAAFASSLPQDMTLEELLSFLAADDEAGQRQILDRVRERLGETNAGMESGQKRLRILTMHGAKGLSGKVVFIPSAEQGIMPSFRAIRATGLLNEQRRLFYVSLTRAKAACIITHAALHSGAEAFLIQQKPQVRLPRSQFLNETSVQSKNRSGGLTAAEVVQIASDVNNL
jgi:DNA helicase II / ATP-dependent DNA helicase PcrA